MKHLPSVFTFVIKTCAGARGLRRFLRRTAARTGLPALLLTAILAAPSVGRAGTFVFGDSGADMGNYWAIPEIAMPPGSPYFRGSDGLARLSNGPMWPELQFPGMRTWADPHRSGDRINYAFGGAKSDRELSPDEITPQAEFGLLSQLDLFDTDIAAGKTSVAAGSTAFLYAGTNDLFEALTLGQDVDAKIADIVANLKTAVNRLAERGVSKIYVSEVADFAYAPAFLGLDLSAEQRALLETTLNGITENTRQAVRSGLAQPVVVQGKRVDVIILPLNRLFQAVRANPGAYGFTQVTGSIYDVSADRMLVPDVSQQTGYFFLDSLHTTAHAQALEGRFYRAFLNVGEGWEQRKVARLTDSGISALDTIRRTIEAPRASGTLVTRPGGAWDISLLTPVSVDRYEGGDGRPSLRVDTEAFLLGMRWPRIPTPNLQLTAGYLNQDGKADSNGLRFDSNGPVVALSNRIPLGWADLGASVSRGWLRMKTTRSSDASLVFPAFETRGKTDLGIEQATLNLSRRYAREDDWAVELSVGGRYSRATLDGFHERGDLGMDLTYSKTRYESARAVTVAVFVAPEWTAASWLRIRPELAITSEYEFGDRDTTVRAQLPDTPGLWLDGTLDRGDRWRAIAEPRLQLRLSQHALATLSYSYERSGSVERHSFWLNLSQRF
ncbi:hypothetical protein DB347_23090 [Opitutaceae bacterium EW11]|nr:hypothetical protein DB347_23090 [Opitutaceae bacterium EW11]